MEINRDWKSTFEDHVKGGLAFTPIEKILEKVEFSNLGIRPAGLPYSFYEVFYHMWFTQRDIVEYCEKKYYKAPSWPEDYWPENTAPQDEDEWKTLQKDYFSDREKLLKLLGAKNDIFERVPSNSDHTFIREIMLVIEHNSYHSGQLFIILRLLDQYS